MRIAILTDSRYVSPATDDPYNCQILLEEAWLGRFLQEAGASVARVAWSDPGVDWSSFDAAVLRSTWDYFERFDEFAPWLERVSSQTRLFNSAALVRWNMDKHYLLDLERQGVLIVPTAALEAGSRASLKSVLDERGWERAVMKPAVSGAARLTFRVDQENIEEREPLFAQCVEREAMLVQPFIPSVMERGEVSLIVVDGRCTHAVRKVPRSGDFRVQDDHGGTVHHFEPSDVERAAAERAVAACLETPLYARVDLVDDGGSPRLMELELIEPELFFRFCPMAAGRLAAAVCAALETSSLL
jgi:glutathione synthase/RimK-type ligase-like ATP-grasp enzyme